MSCQDALHANYCPFQTLFAMKFLGEVQSSSKIGAYAPKPLLQDTTRIEFDLLYSSLLVEQTSYILHDNYLLSTRSIVKTILARNQFKDILLISLTTSKPTEIFQDASLKMYS